MEIEIPESLSNPLIWATVLVISIYLAIIDHTNAPLFFVSPLFKAVSVIVVFFLMTYDVPVGTLFAIVFVSSLIYGNIRSLNTGTIYTKEEEEDEEIVVATSKTQSTPIAKKIESDIFEETDLNFSTMSPQFYVHDEGDNRMLLTSSNNFLENNY